MSGGHEELLGQLYDASSGSSSWADTMLALATWAGAEGHDIVFRDRMSGALQPGLGPGCGETCMLDPVAVEAYETYYSARDPSVVPALMFPNGQLWSVDELVPLERWHRSEIYNDWMSVHGVDWLLGTSFPINSRLVVAASFRHSRRPFTADDKARIQPLIPHLARAVDLALRLRMLAASEQVAWAILDQLSDAVLALDAEGRILYANAAGESLRAEGLLRRGKVPGRGLPAQRPPERVRSGGTSYLWEFRPAPPRLGRLGAVALAFVSSEQRPPSPSNAWLRAAFDLTPAEARLLRALISGESVRDAALAFGVRETTCRNQLKAIFRKTETGRQGELVSLVLRSLPRLEPGL